MTNEFHQHLKTVISRADEIVHRMDRLRYILKSPVEIEKGTIGGSSIRMHEMAELEKLVITGAESEMKMLISEYDSLKVEIPLCQ